MEMKVGIIYNGRMVNTSGSSTLHNRHAAGYAVVEETEMVAVCDSVVERRKAFQKRWNVPRGYADYCELIDVEKTRYPQYYNPTGAAR